MVSIESQSVNFQCDKVPCQGLPRTIKIIRLCNSVFTPGVIPFWLEMVLYLKKIVLKNQTAPTILVWNELHLRSKDSGIWQSDKIDKHFSKYITLVIFFKYLIKKIDKHFLEHL